MTLAQRIKICIYIGVGFLYVSFFAYLRGVSPIFFPRIPKELFYLYNWNLSILCIWILSIHVFLLIKLLSPKKPLPKFIQKILSKLALSLKMFFELFYFGINRTKKTIRFCAENIPEYIYEHPLYLFYVIEIFPRIFVPSVFLIETVYFEKLNYFYKSLILFGLPLLFSGIMYMLNYWADKLLTFICLDLDRKPGPNFLEDDDDYTLILKKNIIYPLFPNFEEYMKNMTLTIQIRTFYKDHQGFKNSILYKYALGFLHASYILGWSVIGLNLILSNKVVIEFFAFQLLILIEVMFKLKK